MMGVDDDIEQRVRAVEVAQAVVASELRNLDSTVRAMADGLELRDRALLQERGQDRRAKWALVAALLVALLGAIATIVAAGLAG